MANEDRIALKALVLCAGYGTRLKPLTDVVPKPLVTVLNLPLVDLAIERCAKAGALDISINTHHLAKVMASHAQSTYLKLGARSLHISEEIPEILGTGGALSAISGWWGDSRLLVYNGDIISNLDLEALVAKQALTHAVVSIAVTRSPPSGGGRSVWVDQEGVVKAIATRADLPKSLHGVALAECGFACAYVADPRLRRYLPETPQFFDVIKAFQAAIADGLKITANFHDGFWADVGTPETLWKTNLELASLSPKQLQSIIGDLSTERYGDLPANTQIDSISVVSALAKVGQAASISESVILAGGVVADNEMVSRSIRGPNFTVTITSTP